MEKINQNEIDQIESQSKKKQKQQKAGIWTVFFLFFRNRVISGEGTGF